MYWKIYTDTNKVEIKTQKWTVYYELYQPDTKKTVIITNIYKLEIIA